MQEFPCLLVIRVIATDGIAIGTREITLPFAPSPGIHLNGAFTEPPEEDESGPLLVSYDTVMKRFMLGDADDHAYESGCSMAQAMALYHPDFEWTTDPHSTVPHPHSGIN